MPPDTVRAGAGEEELPSGVGMPAVPPASGRRWRVAAFARDRAAFVAAVFLLLVAGAALLAPLLSPYDPAVADNLLRYAAPGTAGHLLGTDAQGRDMLSRLLWGGRVSLVVGIVPVAVASMAGLALGLLAGTAGGWTDQVIMRLLDIVFAFPMVLLAIAIAGVLRPGLWTEVVSITVVLIPYIGRLARTATLSVASMPFVEAARAAGATRTALLLRYVTPGVLPPLLVYATTLIGLMIVVGSGLSFLGLGVQPPASDWGAMVSEGRVVLRRAPHATVLPGLVIVAVSLAFSFLGDGLRDALDPRSRRR